MCLLWEHRWTCRMELPERFHSCFVCKIALSDLFHKGIPVIQLQFTKRLLTAVFLGHIMKNLCWWQRTSWSREVSLGSILHCSWHVCLRWLSSAEASGSPWESSPGRDASSPSDLCWQVRWEAPKVHWVWLCCPVNLSCIFIFVFSWKTVKVYQGLLVIIVFDLLS